MQIKILLREIAEQHQISIETAKSLSHIWFYYVEIFISYKSGVASAYVSHVFILRFNFGLDCSTQQLGREAELALRKGSFQLNMDTCKNQIDYLCPYMSYIIHLKWSWNRNLNSSGHLMFLVLVWMEISYMNETRCFMKVETVPVALMTAKFRYTCLALSQHHNTDFKTQLTSFLPIIQHSPSNCQWQTHLHSYHPHTLHLHRENSAHLAGGLSPCHLAVKIRGEPRLFQRFINRLDQNIVHVYMRYAIAVHLAQLRWLKFNLERPRDWKSRAQSVFENVEMISMAPVLCRCGSSCIVPPTSLAVSL